MGFFVNRTVEEYVEEHNVTYFLRGELPPPNMLLDDIEGVVYKSFGWNHLGQRMYFKTDMDKI